ncbi:MAG TPA: type II CAAX endopeptidase family protein [Bacteroidota bacterium]|nr:type II CAAX endopeptidase family protein [Bacteroidota bacterium]
MPHVAGIVIALSAAIVLRAMLQPHLPALEPDERILIQLAAKWTVTLVLVGIVLLWEREPLHSIGLRRLSRDDALWAFVGFVIAGVIISATIPLLKSVGLGTTEAGVRRLGEFSIPLRLLMVLTAAITEEIQYRGYPIERLYRLTGNLHLSAAITYVVFVALHVSFWTVGGAIQIGLTSIVLYALYMKRRNLGACMLMHFLNNAVAFLVIPEFLKTIPTSGN